MAAKVEVYAGPMTEDQSLSPATYQQRKPLRARSFPKGYTPGYAEAIRRLFPPPLYAVVFHPDGQLGPATQLVP